MVLEKAVFAVTLLLLCLFSRCSLSADPGLSRGSFPKGFVFGTASSAYQVPMADKQKVQAAKDYEIKLTNTFSPLQFPPLTYSNVASTSSKPVQKPETESTYITKTAVEHIQLTNYTQTPPYNTLITYTNQIFPTNSYWLDDPQKIQKFYELILVDSNSVEITHTYDKKTPSYISYSKCVIKNIIPSTEWTSPWTTRTFSVQFTPKGYTYHDYKMAWYRTFYLRPFSHSWFFAFSKNCSDQIPLWFYEWWLKCGPMPQIFPKEIQQAFHIWTQKTTTAAFKKHLQFHKSLQIPWIYCWSFAIAKYHPEDFPCSLLREFKIKWWSKFNNDMCSPSVVLQYIQTGNLLAVEIHKVPKPTLQAVPKPQQPLKTPEKAKAKVSKTTIIEDSSDDSDDEMHQFLKFQKFKKLQKQYKKSISSKSPPSSTASSTAQLGQDSFADDDLL